MDGNSLDCVNVHSSKERFLGVTSPLISPPDPVMLRCKTRGEAPQRLN
jgi:hypothetical protein